MKRTRFAAYSDYVNEQAQTNKRKLAKVWVTEEEIRLVCGHIKNTMPNLKTGICHGVRNGFENDAFARCLSIPVLGTDISNSAGQFPNVVQHDFHQARTDWHQKFDFVYSNSWDHAYDLEKCLAAWADQLKDGGKIFLEWTPEHAGEAKGADACKYELHELIEFLGGRFAIENILHGVMWTWALSTKEKLFEVVNLMAKRNFSTKKIFPFLVIVMGKRLEQTLS